MVLFQYKDFIFVTYGLFGALGAVVGLWAMGVILVGQGLSAGDYALVVLVASVGVLFSSRLGALILDIGLLLRQPSRTLRSVAFASWGGIFAIPFLMMGSALAFDFRLLLLLDACARTVPLGHAIGRLGCISYGCCYGRPSGSALAVTYTHPEAKAVRVGGLLGVPLHPAPLYEIGLNLGLLGALNAVAFLGAPQGVPAMLYALVYGLGRFGLEFLRDNHGRRLWGPLAVNHALSLGLAAVGAMFLPVVLAFPADAVSVSLGQGSREMLPLLPLLALGGVVVFLGFAIHRGRVGVW